MSIKYWLLKSEPSTFSINDLSLLPDKTSCWEGVRNYQARNFMRDEMRVNDLAFFYHSSCAAPGIVGIVKVSKKAYPDHTAFCCNSPYYDAKSQASNPRWWMVDVQLITIFPQIISLHSLRNNPDLSDLIILRKGNRLSITPILASQWNIICKMQVQA